MANKALSKRQKMTIRVEPSQRAGKARNVAPGPSTSQSRADDSRGGARSRQQLLERLLKKAGSS